MSEKTEKEHEHVEDKAEEKTNVFFAKECDFSFKSLEALTNFFDSLRDFSHHLSENHYYSENLNKKVMTANLELHSLSLELREIDVTAEEFFSNVNKAVLAGKTPAVDKKDFAEFKKRLETARSRVFGISSTLKQLVADMKREYGEKI